MATTVAEQAAQYLTFRLGEEVFALDITQVREVLDYTPITRVPRMPEFMRGVINLRGAVVPVVDLRLKFGMSTTERTLNTCIIIAEVAIGGERTLLGALRLGAGSDRSEFGADRAATAPWHEHPHAIHPGDGQARRAFRDHP